MAHAIPDDAAARPYPQSRCGKRSLDDLAIFGGSPAFDEALHVGRPNIGDRDRLAARMADLLERRRLTNDGPYVRELEHRVAEWAGARRCLATCNGTVALVLAIRALGLTGEVILPSFTFAATAHALAVNGITPVFCDIRPHDHLIDPTRVERLITPRTTAIIGVSLWGRTCDTRALDAIARRHGLRLVVDAAHAFGCGGRPAGACGDAEILSFHATKFVNAFEGGAILTDDEALADRLALLRNFGFLDYDDVVAVGINGKMSEASAAMGLTSIDAMEDFRRWNLENYEGYRGMLTGLRGFRLLEPLAEEAPTHHYVVAEVDEDAAGIGRDVLLDVLWRENALVRRYFSPGCHRMAPYASTERTASLESTELVCSRVLVLPTGTSVELEQIERLCGLIAFAIEHSELIVSRRARGV